MAAAEALIRSLRAHNRWLGLLLPCLLAVPTLLAAADGPELDDPIAARAPARVTPEDIAFIERLIARRVTAGQAGSLEVERLQRIRDLLKRPAAAAPQEDPPATSTSPKTELLEILRKNVADSEASRHSVESLVMYHLFLDEPDKALKLLKNTGPAGARDLYHPLRLAYTYLRLGDYTNGNAALTKLNLLLADRLPLRLSEPILCDKITAFRVYEPKPRKPHRPGERSFVYVEIAGVEFKKQADGTVGCNLNFGLELRDDLQTVVWSEPDYGAYSPTFQGPVDAVHASITFWLPNNLRDGRYHLVITARERATKREGASSVAFDVGRVSTTRTPPAPPPAPLPDLNNAEDILPPSLDDSTRADILRERHSTRARAFDSD